MAIVIIPAGPDTNHPGDVTIMLSRDVSIIKWDWDFGDNTVSLDVSRTTLRELRDAINEFLGANQ